MQRILGILSRWCFGIMIIIMLVEVSYVSVLASEFKMERLEEGLVLFIGSPVSLFNNQETLIDENNGKVVPFIIDGRTLVPTRYISEKFGANVTWDGVEKVVTVLIGEKLISFKIGNREMKINDEVIKLDVAPIIDGNSRAFIPLRAFSEGIGKEVFYERGLIIISDDAKSFTEFDENTIDSIIDRVNNLPKISNVSNLEELLGSFGVSNLPNANDKNLNCEDILNEIGSIKADEKKDGEYIYILKDRKIIVDKLYKGTDEESICTLNFQEEIIPIDFYIDDKYMTVIAQQLPTYLRQETEKVEDENSRESNLRDPVGLLGLEQPEISVEDDVYYNEVKEEEVELTLEEYANQNIGIIDTPFNGKCYTKAIVFDIQDKRRIKRIRDVDIEGQYINSKQIENVVYIISNKEFKWFGDLGDLVTPSYLDTAKYKDYGKIELGDIRYFPDMTEPNYLMIASINSDSNKTAQMYTYLGAGRKVLLGKDYIHVSDSSSVEVDNLKFLLDEGKVELFKDKR